MTWWTGVPPERRAQFVAELQHRLDSDQVPYRVGRARHRGGLVFRCQVKGRGQRAKQERIKAFEDCSIHEQLLRLEMFDAQPAFPDVRHALAWLVALLLPQKRCVQRELSVPGDQLSPDRIDAVTHSAELHG
jgi:hypothetical protein